MLCWVGKRMWGADLSAFIVRKKFRSLNFSMELFSLLIGDHWFGVSSSLGLVQYLHKCLCSLSRRKLKRPIVIEQYYNSLVIYDDFNTLRQSVLLKGFSSSSCLDCLAASDPSAIFVNKISNSVGLGFFPLARSLEKFSS